MRSCNGFRRSSPMTVSLIPLSDSPVFGRSVNRRQAEGSRLVHSLSLGGADVFVGQLAHPETSLPGEMSWIDPVGAPESNSSAAGWSRLPVH